MSPLPSGLLNKTLNKLHVFLLVLCVGLDQVTKWAAQLGLGFYKKVIVLPHVLTFELVHNHGAAYGIFHGQRVFLLLVSVVVIVGSIIWQQKIIQSQYSKYAVLFLLAGAIGNFIDRFVLGYVIDFINIHILPVFNFADIFINIAVGLFIVEMVIYERKKDSLQ